MNDKNRIEPKERLNDVWDAVIMERFSACDNRPGLKMIYVTVMDAKGEPLPYVKVRFDTEPSYGIAYDHRNDYGLADENGYLEWRHLGKPTRYRLYMEDDPIPLIENIRTDLPNEYCRGGWWPPWAGNRPVNRPGIYSYTFLIQRRY